MWRRLAVTAAILPVFIAAGPSPVVTVEQTVEQCHKFLKMDRGTLSFCNNRVLLSEFGSGSFGENDLLGEVADVKHAYDVAIEAFDKAIKANPKDERGYIGRGIAYIGKGRFDDAEDDFHAALEMSPDDPAAFLDRGTALLAQLKTYEAMTDFNQAIRLKPDNAAAYAARGTAYEAKDDLTHARADLNAAIDIDPNSAGFYFDRSIVDNKAYDYAQALKDMDRAHILEPNLFNWTKESYANEVRLLAKSFDCKTEFVNAIAAFDWLDRINAGSEPYGDMYAEDRARCFSAHGDDDKAIAQYGEMIARKEKENDSLDASEFRLERAEAEARVGKIDEALADLNVVIDHVNLLLGSIRSEPFFNRGAIYLSKGNYAAAISDFSNAIDQDSGNAKSYAARGAAYAAGGDAHHGLADFNAALRLDPTNADAFLGRANLHESKGEYPEALSDYDQAIALEPGNARAFVNRCFTRAVANAELDAALADCQHAQSLEPSNAGAVANISLVYLRMGRYADAIAGYTRALQMNPASAWALYGRGIAKSRNGDAVGGNADIASARSLNATVDAAFRAMGLAG